MQSFLELLTDDIDSKSLVISQVLHLIVMRFLQVAVLFIQLVNLLIFVLSKLLEPNNCLGAENLVDIERKQVAKQREELEELLWQSLKDPELVSDRILNSFEDLGQILLQVSENLVFSEV